MTNPKILVDTYTWIEIFQDSSWGREALACIEKNSPVAVSVLTLYELQYRITELSGRQEADTVIEMILSHTDVVPVDSGIAIQAGAIKAGQPKKGSSMGAVDCMILATARLHGLKILSGDKHFSNLEENLDPAAP
jgi:predicted nucleic acid-binding protein